MRDHGVACRLLRSPGRVTVDLHRAERGLTRRVDFRADGRFLRCAVADYDAIARGVQAATQG